VERSRLLMSSMRMGHTALLRSASVVEPRRFTPALDLTHANHAHTPEWYAKPPTSTTAPAAQAGSDPQTAV
jgi:hypothetical protein